MTTDRAHPSTPPVSLSRMSPYVKEGYTAIRFSNTSHMQEKIQLLGEKSVPLQGGLTSASFRGEGLQHAIAYPCPSPKEKNSLSRQVFCPFPFGTPLSVPRSMRLFFSFSLLVLSHMLVLLDISFHKVSHLHRVDFTTFAMTDL